MGDWEIEPDDGRFALAEELDLDVADLEHEVISCEVLALVPASMAWRHAMLPFTAVLDTVQLPFGAIAGLFGD